MTIKPPYPPFALQIGITGHRKLNFGPAGQAGFEQSLARILQDIQAAYELLGKATELTGFYEQGATLKPRLLSSLAEGADSLAATAALAEGYELHCPLPFPRSIYAKDFTTAQSVATFDTLLSQATRVLELDGHQHHKDQAYLSAGEVVLQQADLLLAVWDGTRNPTSPGTAGIVAAALQWGVPIIWLSPADPQAIQVHDPREPDKTWQPLMSDRLLSLLRWRLLPSAPVDNPSDRHQIDRFSNWLKKPKPKSRSLDHFFHHAEAHTTFIGLLYQSLFSLLGKHKLPKLFGNNYRQNAKAEWQALADAAKQPLSVDPAVAANFVQADSLACFYADRYRGSFVFSFILGGIAVLLAVLGAPFRDSGHELPIYAVLELVTILTIAWIINRGRKQDFHQRWVDFRLLAERFRQLAVLTPISGRLNYALHPFDSEGDKTHALIDWLIRAHQRATGMPSVSFDSKYRDSYRRFLITLIEHQANYHRHNSENNERIAHALHGLNRVFLVLIAAACSGHIVCGLFVHHLPEFLCRTPVEILLTLITASLPAFGAAAAGILSQGEFERIAQRSKGMAQHLTAIANQLKQNPDTSVLELSQQAHNAIDIMNQELSDWRVIFRAKTLEMHA